MEGKKSKSGFEIKTGNDDVFEGEMLIFASGLKDIMHEIPGFSECWGISVIHCPYCHGYKVRNEKTGILANGDFGYLFKKMITNWTKDLTLFTNGKSTLTAELTKKLTFKGVKIPKTEIENIEHTNGLLHKLIFKDGFQFPLHALYAKTDFVQSSKIPSQLDFELTEHGLIKVDQFQKLPFREFTHAEILLPCFALYHMQWRQEL